MRDEDRDDEDRYDPAAPPPPSKSQRKREATALQELGERVVKLTPAQLSCVPLPDELLAAVRVAQGIAQRGGRKRQLQYIGKLMRQLDEAETEAIRAVLTTLLPGGRL
ncbi:MAG: ribosome biogenesis factor YjgA [Candidatus Contendobacter sp.]|nr:ribosome biogenesis factor YjgA [Candidatus Contendobacter sp.]MDS4060071.1 ribosome biogenesis factor YjgA [Candidatus Contendobacter sp.]